MNERMHSNIFPKGEEILIIEVDRWEKGKEEEIMNPRAVTWTKQMPLPFTDNGWVWDFNSIDIKFGKCFGYVEHEMPTKHLGIKVNSG